MKAVEGDVFVWRQVCGNDECLGVSLGDFVRDIAFHDGPGRRAADHDFASILAGSG